MFYYILLFADRFAITLVDAIGQSLGRNAAGKLPTDNWFLPSSPYEMASGWALVCLLLTMGCLEGISVRLVRARVNFGILIRCPSADAINRQANALSSWQRIILGHDGPTEAHFS